MNSFKKLRELIDKKNTEMFRNNQNDDIVKIQLQEHQLIDSDGKQVKKDSNMPKLLIEENSTYLQLLESKNGKIKVRGEFGRVGVPTLNGRIYPEPVMQRGIDRLRESLDSRRVFGTIDHPENGKTSLKDVSHIITDLKIKDGIVVGEAEILNTPSGKIIQALIESGVQVPVSSRGMGSTKPSSDPKVEGEVVQDDFILKTWDFVAEPAVISAIPQAFTEDVDVNDTDIAQMFLDEFPEIAKSLQEDAVSNAKIKVNKGVDEAIKEAEEKVRKEMSEKFEKRLAESLVEAREDISNELKEEFESDPELGGAKAMLSAIWEMVAPFRANEDEQALIDAEKAKELEISRAKQEAEDSEKRAIKAECIAYIEKEIGGHYMAESIRKLVSKHDFENIEDAKDKLSVILKDIPDRTEEGISEEEMQIREENASMREKLSVLTDRVESLNVKLKRAVDVGLKADTQLREAESRVNELESKLEENLKEIEELKESNELEIYKRDKVILLPNGRELLSLMEGVNSKAVVDELVSKQGIERVSEAELNEARRNLKRGISERQMKEQLNESHESIRTKRIVDKSKMDQWQFLAGISE